MSRPTRCVVIGAGLIGLSTADCLVARGCEVHVIDQKSGPGLGASFNNSGMIHPSQIWPWNNAQPEAQTLRDWHNAAIISRDLTRERMRTLGLSWGGESGVIYQIFTQISAQLAALERYHTIDADVAITDDIWGLPALELREDIWSNAYTFCIHLEAGLRAKGVRFSYGVTDTPAADTTDHIIIAAGAASADIAKAYGLKLGLKPVKGHGLNFVKPSGITWPSGPVMHAPSRSTLTVFEDHVRVSGSTGLNAPEDMLEIWAKICPEIINQLGSPILRWSANRPVSETGFPVIKCLDETRHIWVNTGHGHMGWSLCAISGQYLADALVAHKA